MQTDNVERLLSVQLALLAHQRWLAGLQASPFSQPEMDAEKAAIEARRLNPATVPEGFVAEDYDADCELDLGRTKNQLRAVEAGSVDTIRALIERWDAYGLPDFRG